MQRCCVKIVKKKSFKENFNSQDEILFLDAIRSDFIDGSDCRKI